jgi:hypothetical protein
MPLTPKGKKIMKAMRKQYGKKEGESVFYASKNKGTIKGVDEDMDINEGEVKRRNKKLKNKRPRANFPEGQASDDVTPARNPQGTSDDGPGEDRGVKKVKGEKKKSKYPRPVDVMRRTKSREGKNERAKTVMKKRLKEMAHTVYHDMGYLMAESLGLVSEEEYDSSKELRRELDAEARRTGAKSGDDVILKGPVTKPETKPKKKKIVIRRKKKATKKSKPPTDRQIAQRWRGPDASPLGG